MRKLATVADVFKELEPVMDPEHPISITDPRMEIVKEEYIDVSDNIIKVRFKPTVPYCPMGGLIGVLIRNRLETVYRRLMERLGTPDTPTGALRNIRNFCRATHSSRHTEDR